MPPVAMVGDGVVDPYMKWPLIYSTVQWFSCITLTQGNRDCWSPSSSVSFSVGLGWRTILHY